MDGFDLLAIQSRLLTITKELRQRAGTTELSERDLQFLQDMYVLIMLNLNNPIPDLAALIFYGKFMACESDKVLDNGTKLLKSVESLQ